MANDALAQKAQNFTNRGRQALESGRYELAVDMLMEAVAAAPDVLETRKLVSGGLPCYEFRCADGERRVTVTVDAQYARELAIEVETQ